MMINPPMRADGQMCYSGLRWQVSGPEVNSRPRCASGIRALSVSGSKSICLRAIRSDQYHRPRPYQPPPNTIKITMMRIRSVVVFILASC